MTRFALALFGLCFLLISGCATEPTAHTWHVVTGPHFTLYGDIPERDLRRDAMNLEHFRQVVEKITQVQIPPDSPRTWAVIFRNDYEFKAYRPGDRVAGWFSQQRPDNIIAMEEGPNSEIGREIIQHEYVHYIMRYAEVKDPHWYEEGLADVLSTVKFKGDQVVLGNLPLMRAYSILASIPTTSFAEITADDYNVIESPWSRDEYAQYWAAVHYCLFDNRKRYDDLAKYLTLRTLYGEGNVEAFKQAFHADPDTFWEEVAYNLRRKNFYTATLSVKNDLKPVSLRERDASADEIRARLAVVSHIATEWRCELAKRDAAHASKQTATEAAAKDITCSQ